MMEKEILAWSQSLASDGGNYYIDDLCNNNDIVQLFEKCKKKEAIILSEGWKHLFKEFGLINLITIDKAVQWFCDSNQGEWVASMIHESLLSGYNPLLDEMGDYDESSGLFLTYDGAKQQVDWDEIKKTGNSISLDNQ